MIKWERPMLISLSGTAGAYGTCTPMGSGDSASCSAGNSAGAKCYGGNAAIIGCINGNSPSFGYCTDGNGVSD